MKNNRIAIDVRMLGASGIGTYIEALLREFVRLKHNFQFVLIGNGEKIEKLAGKSSRFIVQHTDVPVFSISEQFYLPKLARDADLFHSPHHNVPVLWRKKLIVTFHDALHWDFPELLPDWKAKYYLKMVSKKIKNASAVIVPSEFTADRIFKNIKIAREKIHIIHQGVDTHFFSRRSLESTRAILKKYGLVPGEFLLYVGNMKPHKNIERLVSAYSLARRNGLRVKLVLAGKIKGLKKIVDIKKLTSNDGVIYIGAIPFSELPYFYSGARAFVFISLYEGFGLPPLEAMACGCPVLVSNAASLPEVVGDAAMLTNPEDDGEIAEKLQKICVDIRIRKNLIAKSRQRIKLFSWTKTAEMTYKIYKNILEGKL